MSTLAETPSHVMRWENPPSPVEHPLLGELRANPNRWAAVAECYTFSMHPIELALAQAGGFECRRVRAADPTDGWTVYARYNGDSNV